MAWLVFIIVTVAMLMILMVRLSAEEEREINCSWMEVISISHKGLR